MRAPLLPAERDLSKRCVNCGALQSLDEFYPRSRTARTQDGRRVRSAWCRTCTKAENREKHGERPRTNQARNRARSRAYVRLSRLVPELWEQVFEEELEKEELS